MQRFLNAYPCIRETGPVPSHHLEQSCGVEGEGESVGLTQGNSKNNEIPDNSSHAQADTANTQIDTRMRTGIVSGTLSSSTLMSQGKAWGAYAEDFAVLQCCQIRKETPVCLVTHCWACALLYLLLRFCLFNPPLKYLPPSAASCDDTTRMDSMVWHFLKPSHGSKQTLPEVFPENILGTSLTVAG